MIPEWLPLELELSSNSYEADIKKCLLCMSMIFLRQHHRLLMDYLFIQIHTPIHPGEVFTQRVLLTLLHAVRSFERLTMIERRGFLGCVQY